MPTVPRYQRQVAPQRLPSGARRAVETETSAGVGAAQARAYVGRGAEQLGGAIADVGSKFLNIAYSQRAKEQQEAKDYADQLAVLGANNKLSNFERTLYADGGAFTLQGEAAFHLPETVNAQFDKTADEIEFGMTNPEQKLAFARLRSQRGQSIALDVERHVSSEIKKFAVTELQASRDNSTDAAILKGGAGDFTRAGEEMAAHETALRTVGPKLGMGPEAIDADISSYRSNIHIGIINQLLADGQNKTAKLYFDETKDEIAGDKRDDVTNALKENTTKADAQKLSDEILAEGGTLTEQRTKAKERATSADEREMALGLLEHEAAVGERTKREVEEARDLQVYNILDTGKGVRAIPPAMWQSMDGAARNRARDYADQLGRTGTGGATKTNMNALYGLLTLSQSDPEKFKWKTNLMDYINVLGKEDLEQMMRKQVEMRAGKAGTDIYATEGVQNEIINAGLRSINLDPAGDTMNLPENKARLDKFRRAVREAVDREYPPSGGKRAPREAIQAIVDTLTAETAAAKTGAFVWDTPARYAYEEAQAQVETVDQVPVGERRKIEAALRGAGIPISNQAVIDLFNQQLRKVRGD